MAPSIPRLVGSSELRTTSSDLRSPRTSRRCVLRQEWHRRSIPSPLPHLPSPPRLTYFQWDAMALHGRRGWWTIVRTTRLPMDADCVATPEKEEHHAAAEVVMSPLRIWVFLCLDRKIKAAISRFISRMFVHYYCPGSFCAPHLLDERESGARYLHGVFLRSWRTWSTCNECFTKELARCLI